jgi:hypothetical protein
MFLFIKENPGKLINGCPMSNGFPNGNITVSPARTAFQHDKVAPREKEKSHAIEKM